MTDVGRMIYEEGLEEGLEEGIENGMQKGIEKGIEEGKEKGKAEMLIKQLIKKFKTVPEEYKKKIMTLSKHNRSYRNRNL